MKLTRDDLYKMVQEAASKAVADRIGEAKDKADKRIADEAQGLVAGGNDTDDVPSMSQRKQYPLGQLARAIAVGHGNKDATLGFLKSLKGGGDPMVHKALAEAEFTSGGALVEPEFAAEIIELLSARTVVRKAGATSVPLESGTMQMPYIGSGAVAQWTGEAEAVNATTMTFGQLTLRGKELVAIVPISNKLLRHTGNRADGIVQQDLVRALSVAEDVAFIRGLGSEAAPKGLLYWAASDHKFDANSTVNQANVTDDLGTAIFNLEDSDVDIMNGHWIINPETKKGLMTARDANSNLVWKDEMKDGTLFGFPFDYTTSVPRNLGTGTDESEVYFADMDKIVIGDDETIQIDVFDGAAYVDSAGTVRSAVSQNQTVIRALLSTDLGARQRGEEISVIEAVKWSSIPAT